MAIQKKHGKGRLDKWYKLAKEKGFRARAAFKLIQLNRKYGFLEKTRVLLDLCAAPGSWCQVAVESMPVNGLLIGVDLAPIKPIPRVTLLQSDITTDKCCSEIRAHLKSWKVDTVLHDGAPNVGIAWAQDAYTQAELVLQALKLATDFLDRGGTFVTKIFRSKDYNSLLWVFNQLFDKVEATKPPASRNVSAEIFVVCQGFRAPHRIDPQFLDSRAVFADLQRPAPNHEAKVFNPAQRRRERDGYDTSNILLRQDTLASEFIKAQDPIAILGSSHSLSFEQPAGGDLDLEVLSKLSDTTLEIKHHCEDLRVLGRKEFRSLLRWRSRVRVIFGLTGSALLPKEEPTDIVQVIPLDENLRIRNELQALSDKEANKVKKERRRESERRSRETRKLQMQMQTPYDLGIDQHNSQSSNTLFSLSSLHMPIGATAVQSDHAQSEGMPDLAQSDDSSSHQSSETNDEDDTDWLEAGLDTLYEDYKERRMNGNSAKRIRTAHHVDQFDEWSGFSGGYGSQSPSVTDDEDLSDETGRNSHGLFASSQIDASTNVQDSIFEEQIFHRLEQAQGRKRTHPTGSVITRDSNSPAVALLSSNAILEVGPEQGGAGEESGVRAMAKRADQPSGAAKEHPDNAHRHSDSNINIVTARAMMLAQDIASGSKVVDQLVDDRFHKRQFYDQDDLPLWFVDEERKHSIPHKPVTAAAAYAIREKDKALNARPIKKVQEAKNRKLFKAAKRLNKLREKSALLIDDDAMTEQDKAKQASRIMAQAMKKKRGKPIRVVVARGSNKAIAGRPRGVKGRYKIVDARLKKDVRAVKRMSRKAS